MERTETDIHYLVELLAYWEGIVNTTVLIKHIHMSRQHTQKHLKSYQQRYPDNLCYNKSLKGFTPNKDFVAHYISGDVNQYLDWITSQSAVLGKAQQLSYTVLSIPKRLVSPLVMRGLVAAIKHNKRLDVEYVSLSSPQNQGRVIQPHVFVKTGLRWHLRAYCEEKKQFRDFVLSRFRGVPELLSTATHQGIQDNAWHTFIPLIFQPDHRLDPKQKALIEHDYQMQIGQLIVNTRAALAQYLINELQVNTKFHDEKAEAQQLVLVNKDDIKQWLFNA
jgi:predicted DNA-binding transcriptional regulator YafY